MVTGTFSTLQFVWANFGVMSEHLTFPALNDCDVFVNWCLGKIINNNFPLFEKFCVEVEITCDDNVLVSIPMFGK